MSNSITRSYTFSNGGVADGGQVDAEIQGIVNTINNADAGTSRWTVIDATTLKYLGQDIAQLCKYRRAGLSYNSGSVVATETGLNGTSGQLSVLFPDLTYRTDSTSGRIQCNLAQVAALTGTAQSGIRTGSVAANTWYAFYAVKSQVNTTDIVLVADTVLPTQANYATLNSNFGTSSWVYLGCLPYGDGAGATTAIPVFVMSGNRITFYNNMTGSVGSTLWGVRLATSAGATSLTWTYAAGTALGSGQLPNSFIIGNIGTAMTSSTSILITDQATGIKYLDSAGLSGIQLWLVPDVALTRGIVITPSGSTALDINLVSYVDNVLGIGTNPIL